MYSLSLEREFERQVCCKVDIAQDCGFDEFLCPNEGNPQKMAPHLQGITQRGISVLTGTERSFFHLLFSNETIVYDATYYSYMFEAMKESDKIELKQLYTKLIKFAADDYYEGENERNLALWLNIKVSHASYDGNPYDHSVGAFYSTRTFKAVKQYMARNFIEFTRIGFVDMSNIYGHSIIRLNALSQEEIQQSCQNPEMKRFLPKIIECWTRLKPSTYLAFSKIEGWNDAFERYFCSPSNTLALNFFLKRLEDEKLMNEFIKIFGEQNLEILKNPFLRNLNFLIGLIIHAKDALINFTVRNYALI